jgi:hypothetical protein
MSSPSKLMKVRKTKIISAKTLRVYAKSFFWKLHLESKWGRKRCCFFPTTDSAVSRIQATVEGKLRGELVLDSIAVATGEFPFLNLKCN